MTERDADLVVIQKLIDQLQAHPEWRNGAVLAYNAIAALLERQCSNPNLH